VPLSGKYNLFSRIRTTVQTLLLCMDYNLSYSSLFPLDMEYTLYIH